MQFFINIDHRVSVFNSMGSRFLQNIPKKYEDITNNEMVEQIFKVPDFVCIYFLSSNVSFPPLRA